MGGKLIVVVGGQYGSEGKGAITAHLAKTERRPVLCVRVAGPNAGHTVVDEYGEAHALRHLPVAAYSRPGSRLMLAAGSEIDYEVLTTEVADYRLWCETHGHPKQPVMVDSQATVLERSHRDAEVVHNLVGSIGSTGKGVGAARAARAMRTAHLVGDGPLPHGCWEASSSGLLNDALDDDACVIVEGTQGYGLGTHAGHYPKCTTSDCRAVDFLAMAGLSPWADNVDEFEVWVVFRVYPIRVAGNSGPLIGETTWDNLGLPAEHTTVTKKVRRVGAWDTSLAHAALAGNGSPGPNVMVALTMFDQVSPESAGMTDVAQWSGMLLNDDAAKAWSRIKRDVGFIDMVGTGPASILDFRVGV